MKRFFAVALVLLTLASTLTACKSKNVSDDDNGRITEDRGTSQMTEATQRATESTRRETTTESTRREPTETHPASSKASTETPTTTGESSVSRRGGRLY